MQLKTVFLVLCVAALAATAWICWAAESIRPELFGDVLIYAGLGAGGVAGFWLTKDSRSFLLKVITWLPGLFLLLMLLSYYMAHFSAPRPFSDEYVTFREASLQWDGEKLPQTRANEGVLWIGPLNFETPGLAIGFVWGILAPFAVPVIGNGIRRRRHENAG